MAYAEFRRRVQLLLVPARRDEAARSRRIPSVLVPLARGLHSVTSDQPSLRELTSIDLAVTEGVLMVVCEHIAAELERRRQAGDSA